MKICRIIQCCRFPEFFWRAYVLTHARPAMRFCYGKEKGIAVSPNMSQRARQLEIAVVSIRHQWLFYFCATICDPCININSAKWPTLSAAED